MQDTSSQNTKRNIIRNRSAAYPRDTLEEAIKNIQLINSALGNFQASRDVLAEALGHKSISGSAIRKIAALVHYGLLARTGDVYQISDLAKRIIMPISEEDKVMALATVVRKPKLFDVLISKYTDSAIPKQLDNILVHQYQINQKVSKDVVSIFTSSIKYAGLLKNGIVLNKPQPKNTKNEDMDANNKNTIEPQTNEIHNPKEQVENEETIEIQLPSGIKIIFPSSMAFDLATGRFSQAIKSLQEATLVPENDK